MKTLGSMRVLGSDTGILRILLIVLTLAGWSVLIYHTFPTGERLLLDFTSYYDAGRALLHNASPYHPEARQYSSAAFLLPPIFAMAMMPLAALPVYTANVVWFLLSLAFLVVGCFSVVRLIGTPTALSRTPGAGVAAVLVVAVLLLPVWTGARLGQITALLFCLSMLGLALRKSGRPALGGALLGAAIAFKLIPLTLAAFALWVGWRRFGIAALVTFAALQLISALAFPAIVAEYWLSAILTIPAISRDVNLSLIGMAARLQPEPATVLRPLAYLLSGAMLLLPFLLAWKARDSQSRSRALALLVAAMASALPLVEHHYMIWLIFPIWMSICILIERHNSTGLLLLAVVFALLSQPYRSSRALLALVPLNTPAEALGEVVLTIGAVLLYALLLAALVERRAVPAQAAVVAVE